MPCYFIAILLPSPTPHHLNPLKLLKILLDPLSILCAGNPPKAYPERSF